MRLRRDEWGYDGIAQKLSKFLPMDLGHKCPLGSLGYTPTQGLS